MSTPQTETERRFGLEGSMVADSRRTAGDGHDANERHDADGGHDAGQGHDARGGHQDDAHGVATRVAAGAGTHDGASHPDHGHGENDHLASIYEGQADQFEAVVPFVRQGLERGERCLYVADDNTEDEVLAALREGGIDVDDALESGALSIHTKADTYLRTGEFEQEAMLDFWRELLEEARDEQGYAGVRAAAEMTWALEEGTDPEVLTDYEAMLNRLYPGEDYVVLCQYNRERFPASVLSDVIRSHPLVVADGTVSGNDHYQPPETYFEGDRPALPVERTVEGLVARARTRHTLRERELFQRELYRITSDPDRTFEEKLDALFELGCEFFDLEMGGLARIDPGSDLFEVETVSGDHEHLAPGIRVALSETYCRAVADGDDTAVGITDPERRSLEESRGYEEFGVRSYLGTKIGIEGGPDWSFWFVSGEPRDEPFSEAERTLHHLMGQWVESELARQRREDYLAALNDLSREVMGADTPTAVCETVVEAADDRLDLPVTAIVRYDEEMGDLRLAAATEPAEALLEATSMLEVGEGAGWLAFVEGEAKVLADPVDPGDGEDQSHLPVGEVLALPLGDHGVLVAGSTAADGFDGSSRDVVETVAANAEAGLDRARREQELAEREQRLGEQNEALARLNRVNDVIRSVHRMLVGSSTREGILQAVCDRFVADDASGLAWVGTHDAAADEVTPAAWAGPADSFPDALAVDAAADSDGPTARAVRTHEVQVRNAIASDPPFDPWQRAALNRGYHACIAVPLVYRDVSYGVLTLYADRPDAFDEMEAEVLAELGETIGYALNALERKQALVSEQSVELGFRVTGGTCPLSRFAAELGSELTVENVVQRADASPGVFVRVGGADPDAVRAAGRDVDGVHELTRLNQRGREALYELRLDESAFFPSLLDRGVVPRSLDERGEEGRVVIRVPQTSDVRSFVDLFEAGYEEVELVARRDVDEPIATERDFEATVRSKLTERQEEILETAYESGFFDWPRELTAQELAEVLDVSQPTVSRHIRAGERTLFGYVFDEE